MGFSSCSWVPACPAGFKLEHQTNRQQSYRDSLTRTYNCVGSNIYTCAQSLHCVWLFTTPWTIVHQVPLSIGFPSQEYWSGGCHFFLQGIFPTQDQTHVSWVLLQWQVDSLPQYIYIYIFTQWYRESSVSTTSLTEPWLIQNHYMKLLTPPWFPEEGFLHFSSPQLCRPKPSEEPTWGPAAPVSDV